MENTRTRIRRPNRLTETELAECTNPICIVIHNGQKGTRHFVANVWEATKLMLECEYPIAAAVVYRVNYNTGIWQEAEVPYSNQV